MKRPAKQFEDDCLERMRKEEARGHATMCRNGVQVSMVGDKLIQIPSLPDFTGVLNGGREFVFDCKCCGQASLQINDVKFKERQLAHLLKRGKFGAISFVLIKWTERRLATRVDPEVTWAFPVHPSHPFWQAVDRGEVKAITREDCEEHGAMCPWNTLPGERKERPDVLAAVRQLETMAAEVTPP
jgi:penicillin-binding protein-related factor A (putative recombinase)